jgi:hypothetical protein
MSDEQRWQRDLEEMEIFFFLFSLEAWVVFWWCVYSSMHDWLGSKHDAKESDV